MAIFGKTLQKLVICMLCVRFTIASDWTPSGRTLGNRTIPFQVIGAGMGKTGTTSLHFALNMLGIAPIHDYPDLKRPNYPVHALAEQIKLKKKGKYDTKDGIWDTAEQWDQIFGRYAGTVDVPGYMFVTELARAYPEAKVVLTVRDSPEAWVESYRKVIHRSRMAFEASWSFRIMRWLRHIIRTESNEEIILAALTWGDVGSPEPQTWWYTEHIEHIRAKIPADRLLEFNVKEGWKPLCDFLGKKVPDAPFPHRNSREQHLERDREVLANVERELQRLLVAAGVVVFSGIYLARRLHFR